MKVRIHKGDEVQVLSGKHRGKTGEVIRVIPKNNTVIVAGVNIAKRSQRPARATMQAGIIDKDMPLPVSAVALICSKDGPTRAAYQVEPDGTKVRVCGKCGGRL
jgi:large subunit ribosomal protein L24